ncbi:MULTISPECIES: glutaredoxin family protein [Deinococcus]|jgi:glutaredoxin|uniref:Glutaredoxin n=6 Tax=Deinococcus TaxID=1298 RepID=A0AAE4BQ93_9DEIO|nr:MULTISPECIES: glutaredoxin family protein [Deinococcus]MBZ9715452.1 glutaredoxin family protein [Deinococcus multiflagellatus]MCD0156164.1 glutaredoxin family protein [Deinococcus sp. 6GRE01]MCD0161209.1 glutaredoxin family protein [Deinococcus sp. 6YEL10]MCD0164054.1 glutaredoxin family protein [Deinococcus sp. 12RED42]MCD0168137.1 glutaredoxin family protein [Deinococcus sp. 23YEL01]
MPHVILYATPTCPDCHALRRWFDRHGVAFEERDLTNPAVAEEAKARYGVRVAPITVVGEQFFYGTFDQQRPKLQALLS